MPPTLEELYGFGKRKGETKSIGLYDKYIVTKTDGSKVDPNAVYFVLRLDSDPQARLAARTYAHAIWPFNHTLSDDILALIERLGGI